jgi:hypothetical protein
MDGVALLNRYDRKYVFHAAWLPELFHQLKNEYRILEVNQKRICQYDSLYFDTPDLQLYHRHQYGRGNRFKIRFRKYVDSSLTFFELKVKTNRERTVKYRIKQPDIAYSLLGEPADFLEKQLPVKASGFAPQLFVSFKRMTLVHQSFPERATIDIGFVAERNGAKHESRHLVIAEIKQERTHRSTFASLLKQHHLPECAISKYCMGIISTEPKIRQNNFKPRLLQIRKIDHDFASRPAC